MRNEIEKEESDSKREDTFGGKGEEVNRRNGKGKRRKEGKEGEMFGRKEEMRN